MAEYLDKNGLTYLWKKIKTKIYPIGSIYISTTNTSPASLWGGSWERLKDRFLLACGDTYTAGSTGGEAQHTLTVNEMPSHMHNFIRPPFRIVELSHPNSGLAYAYTGSTYDTYMDTTQVTGNSQPHNNMPPYVAVYVWKRVS